MKNKTRKQLTLFVSKSDSAQIEEIRSRYNPLQRQLIDAHVTLCREDEIINIDSVINNLKNISQKKISIIFGQPIRFDDYKGVLMPAGGTNEAFHQLRKQVLQALIDYPGKHEPHITLMHPRNSTCSDEIFEAIKISVLPKQLIFNTISLIEQTNKGPWMTLKTFTLTD